MEGEEGKPLFNIGLGYTNFLLYSLHLCSEHSRVKDYSAWFFELLVLYRWVSTRMDGDSMKAIEGTVSSNQDDKDTVKDSFYRMEKFIKEIEPIVVNTNFISGKQIYMKLHRMDMFLRKIIKDAKLEMKEEDDIFETTEEWE